MQRFWDAVSVSTSEEGFAVLLDNRVLRLPGRSSSVPLLLPTPALASAIAAEWQAAGGQKGGRFDIAALPLTRLAASAQDRVAPFAESVIEALSAYGASDLLCYRAVSPPTLVLRQETLWGPWLNWAADALGAPLTTAAGVTPIKQPPRSLAALRQAVSGFDAFGLAGLGVMVPALGSLVLGLAVAAETLSAAHAHQLSHLDEIFQAGFWGEDESAAARRARIGDDVEESALFMALARRG